MQSRTEIFFAGERNSHILKDVQMSSRTNWVPVSFFRTFLANFRLALSTMNPFTRVGPLFESIPCSLRKMMETQMTHPDDDMLSPIDGWRCQIVAPAREFQVGICLLDRVRVPFSKIVNSFCEGTFRGSSHLSAPCVLLFVSRAGGRRFEDHGRPWYVPSSIENAAHGNQAPSAGEANPAPNHSGR